MVDVVNDSQMARNMRPRTSTSRTALGDISNKIKNGFNEVAKKVAPVSSAGKKRKISGSGNENHEIVDLTENPIAKIPTRRNSSFGSSLTMEPEIKINRTFKAHLKGQDPALCLDTIPGMYEIYYQQETKYAVGNYMSKQADINFKMRSILIDWLVEVHHKFKLQTATLWLCINILDRYLDSTSILRCKLQLVGVTSLFIACKFEELFPPEVRDCVYITDFAYDREEVLRMETSILTKLNYDILVPTGFHFLTRYLNCIKASERTRLLAAYYSERNLQEADMLNVPSHKFAAAAVLAALKQQTCQYEDYDKLSMCSSWPRVLAEESGLSELEVTPVMRWMVRHVSEEPQTTSKRKLIAAKKKFSNEKYQCISDLPLPDFD